MSNLIASRLLEAPHDATDYPDHLWVKARARPNAECLLSAVREKGVATSPRSATEKANKFPSPHAHPRSEGSIVAAQMSPLIEGLKPASLLQYEMLADARFGSLAAEAGKAS